MKSINYFGQQITVTYEIEEFLEQDRLRNAVLLKQEKRHVDFVGFDIASVPLRPTVQHINSLTFCHNIVFAITTANAGIRQRNMGLCMNHYHQQVCELNQ